MITVTYLRECFDHDPESGLLTWKARPLHHFKDCNAMNAWNGHYVGTAAGSINNDGYLQCKVARRLFKAHAICWALVHGRLPTSPLDHIDRNRMNNSILNLRECTGAENSRNTVRKNRFGLKGVAKSGSKFTAQISVGMKKMYLGSFDTPELAHAAYCAASTKYHGEFGNHTDAATPTAETVKGAG